MSRKHKEKIRGGLNLYQNKEPAFSRSQRQLLLPKVLYIPVDPGMDERLASAFLDNAIFMGIFELDYPGVDHKTFGRYKIEGTTDNEIALGEHRTMYYDGEKPPLTRDITFDALVDSAKRAFIIDETDGIPLFKKLQIFKERNVQVLIADAIDEEPMVSSSINTLLQKAPQVMDALQIISDTLEVKNTYAVCYADMDDTRTVIPHQLEGIPVKKVGGKYPVRRRLRQKLTQQNPGEVLGLIGVQALLHLYRAVYFGKKQNTTIVTVAGDCVGYSCNVEVAIGTTLAELLSFCGLSRDPSRVIIQGSMGGISMPSLDLPILHSEKAVLVFEKEISNKKLPCINCGRCADVCPTSLAPSYIYKYLRSGQVNAAKALHPERCIDCGCCSYICPARLELAACVHDLKDEVLEEEGRALSEQFDPGDALITVEGE